MLKTPSPVPVPVPSSSSSSSEAIVIQKEVIVQKPRTPTPTPPPPPPKTPTPIPSSSSSSSSSTSPEPTPEPSPIIKRWTKVEQPAMVFDSYTRDTNSDDARRPVRESKFTADWTANSRVVDSDYEGTGVMADRRVVDMDEYKLPGEPGVNNPIGRITPG